MGVGKSGQEQWKYERTRAFLSVMKNRVWNKGILRFRVDKGRWEPSMWCLDIYITTICRPPGGHNFSSMPSRLIWSHKPLKQTGRGILLLWRRAWTITPSRHFPPSWQRSHLPSTPFHYPWLFSSDRAPPSGSGFLLRKGNIVAENNIACLMHVELGLSTDIPVSYRATSTVWPRLCCHLHVMAISRFAPFWMIHSI